MAMDHSSCTHPRDPKGRAWCRANGGPGSGAVWGQPSTRVQASQPVQAPAEAPKATAAPRRTKRPNTSGSVDLGSLPRIFRTAVDWANENDAQVMTWTMRDEKMVDLINANGTLTLTWRPATPEGVHAVSWRAAGTSVTKKLSGVNEGLALLRG